MRHIGITGLPLKIYRSVLDRRSLPAVLCSAATCTCSQMSDLGPAGTISWSHTRPLQRQAITSQHESHHIEWHTGAAVLRFHEPLRNCIMPRRVPPGLVEVVLSYCHCCLVDRSLLELLPYLADKGVGVINASVLSMGLLTKQVCLHSRNLKRQPSASCFACHPSPGMRPFV